MDISKFNFTDIQLQEIYKLYNKFNECNNGLMSNCKISAIQTYIDKKNDFFCSYLCQNMTENGLFNKCEYVQIATDGTVIDLNDLLDNDIFAIVKRLNTMIEIKLF